MVQSKDRDFYVMKGISYSLTNPILFLPFTPTEGHIYATNGNTVLAEDADNILHNLVKFADSRPEDSKFCFAQTDVVWGSAGISSFIRQLVTDHSRYTQSPHHQGETAWVVPANREGIQYAVFSGLAKRRGKFLTRAKAAIIGNHKERPSIDLESDRISFDRDKVTHERVSNSVYRTIENPQSEVDVRYLKNIRDYENTSEILCSNPYYDNPTMLAQDLVGFRSVAEKHNIVDLIASIENFRGYVPQEEGPTYEIGSLSLCRLPGSHGAYNIHVGLSGHLN